MDFERTNSVKETLDLGVIRKLPKLMEDSGYDYHDPFHVFK